MIFPTAADARAHSRLTPIIHDEIRDIERAVIVAIDNGQLGTTVSSTFMTTQNDYWLSWKQSSNDVRTDQMTQVIGYFTKLGYTISRKDVGSTFHWLIQW